MSDQKTGGAAFPRSGSEHGYEAEGMTLRDWFAGQLLSDAMDELYEEVQVSGNPDEAIRKAASVCYMMAGAMIEAREECQREATPTVMGRDLLNVLRAIDLNEGQLFQVTGPAREQLREYLRAIDGETE